MVNREKGIMGLRYNIALEGLVIQKIISNGRPGVGLGAINAAMTLDIPFAGWTPSGRYLDGEASLPSKRSRREFNKEEGNYVQRNVEASEGTLIFLQDTLIDDLITARDQTISFGNPWISIDLSNTGEFQASQTVHEWLSTHEINIIYVTGKITEEKSKLEKRTQNILEAVYYLGLIENNMTAPTSLLHYKDMVDPPASLEGAVSHTIANMSLKDCVTMANLSDTELTGLQGTLGDYIRQRLTFWYKAASFRASLDKAGIATLDEDAVVFFIIRRIWETLQKTHKMRVIK